MEKLLSQYQLEVKDSEILEGYDSINYKLHTTTGNFVLKYYKDPAQFDLIQAEDQILIGLKERLPLQLPHPVEDLKVMRDGSFCRLYPYIEGELLANAECSDALLFSFGKLSALMNKELLDKTSHTIKARKQEWDLQHCLLNKVKMSYIKDPAKQKLVNYFFDLFEHHVLPVQDQLRCSIIHGDLNENNVIIKKDKVIGFIDFGDICYSPLINEIAIALAYIMLLNQDNPVAKACQFLKGYHSELPLLNDEIALLYYLIPARLGVSVCNAAEAIEKGKDTDYILVNQKPAWRFLKSYIGLNPLGITDQFRQALGMKTVKTDYKDLLEKRHSFFSEALSLSYEKPIHMIGAAFQYMFDSKGNTYLDAYNNIPLVGHCHPRISQVISAQARKLNTNTRYLYDELTDYAKKLLARFPEELQKVFFVNSGSAATDLALRLATNLTGRKSFAVLEHGYHGNTKMGIAVSPYKFDGKGGQGEPMETIKFPLPNLFKGKYQTVEEYVADAKEILQAAIARGQKPAALLAEPISGCGGQVPLAAGYLKMLRAFLKQHGILLISDEVQTGFGRLGSHFWGYEMQGVVPDLVILGKPIANSHPMGAVVGTVDIAEAFANGMEFFSSFGGNPVSCAVGLEVLNILEEEGLQENALSTGAYYKKELKKLQTQFPCIADVRGQGLFLGFELLDKNGKAATEMAKVIKNKMKENFVLLSTDGPNDNVVKTKPPLCFNKKNVDQVVSLLEQILKEIS